MVINIQDHPLLKDTEISVENDEVTTLEGMEILDYDNLVNDITKKKITLAGRNKYMLIKFPTKEIPNYSPTILYEIQLLGYIPVISNAEHNIEFRRNPNKLYGLVAKGTLVQIDASSLSGQNGRLLRKFVVKLCRHNLVHFVSSDTDDLAADQPLSVTYNKYFKKKFSVDYVNYLQNNAKKVNNGCDIQIRAPIKFKW